MDAFRRNMRKVFFRIDPDMHDEVSRKLRKFKDHIDKLRRTDVEAFRRKIEESADIESKSRHMRQLIEENVPASLDLLERLLKESEKDPLLYLEWLSHRQNVAMSVETFEKAQQIAKRAHKQAKRLYLLGSPGVSDKGIYEAYIKAYANLLLVCRYRRKTLIEDLKGFGYEDNEVSELLGDVELAESNTSSLFQKAYFEEAQKAAEIEKDLEGQHLLLILKGDLLLAEGHINTAIDTVFTPLLKEPLLSPKNKGLLLQKFGNACRSACLWRLAKEYLRQSISIAQELGDSVSEYARMIDLGSVYKSEGRIADALKYYQLHMAFAYKRGDLQGLNVICFSMSSAYNSVHLNPYQKKHVSLLMYLHFVDFTTLFTSNEPEPWNNDLAFKGVTESAIAELKPLLMNFFGKDCINAFDLVRDYLGSPEKSFPLKNIFPTSPLLNQHLEYLSRCMNLLRKLTDEDKIPNLKGFHSRSVGKFDEAIGCHRQDMKSAQARGDDEAVAVLQRALTMDYLCEKDLERAEEQVKATISSLEIIREKLDDEDESKIANFEKNQLETYNLLQSILCDRKKYAEALAVCELGRSRALTDLIRSKLLETKEPSAQKDDWIYSSDFVSRWQDLVKDIQDDFIKSADELRTNFLIYSVSKQYDNDSNPLYFLYIWLVLNDVSAKGRKDRIHFRKMALSEMIQSELINYRFFSSLIRYTAVQAADETMKAVRAEDDSIDIRMPKGPEVEELFHMLELPSISATNKGVVAASTNQDPQSSGASKRNPSSGERAELILERILEPGSWDVEGIQQLQQLYDVCVSPVEDLLPEEEEGGVVPSITILPHEFLFGVPFCCLQNGAGENKRYLVERFVISYAPSLLALRLLNQRLQYLRTKQGSRPTKVFAMGHALMNLLGIGELPKSGDEAKNVQEVFGPEHCRVALRGDATKQFMLQELRNVDILHVATHASPQNVEEKEPVGDFSMRGCILLSSSDETCDGVVKASEIASVDCECQLVTLSCCETALGKVTGDGVVGLYRAFFAAGAASVVVTHWKIKDDITRMFMEHFYKEFKATGNVSGSLRSTMVYCIREKKIPPQQWAAFSLIGAAQ